MASKLADVLPPRVRAWLYGILATAFGVEAVLDVIDDGVETKALGILAVLGFVLAAGNTPKGDDA